MIIYIILTLISFFGTLYVLPHSIKKLRMNNYLAKDMYKIDKPFIPTNCGIILVFTSFLAISLVPFISRSVNFFYEVPIENSNLYDVHFAFLLVVSVYALYGLVDDLVDIGRVLKLILPIAFSFPLVSVISISTFWIPYYGVFNLESIIISEVSYSDIFRLIIIPIYVMVVANLVNMHSGYNGLQSGLSIILILSICFKAYEDNSLANIFPVFGILGAMMAFLIFNKYPSRAFEGNIGSLFFGSTIGVLIVIQKYWWFGVFILLPHTLNFLLWILWLILMKRRPEEYVGSDGKHRKFGVVREDGTIEVPNRLTLKWIPNYYFKFTEQQSTFSMYIITIFFCMTGLLLF